MRKIFESTGLVKSLGLVGLIATAPIVYAGSVVFGNSTMTLVPSTTKFDTATPLGFDLSGAPCSIFGSDAEAIQNGGCSVDLSFTNVLYSGEIYVGENPDKVNMLTLNVGRSARPNFGAFQVKANIKKYDINGNISDIDDKTVFNGIAQHRSSDITLNQDKTSYIAVKDDVRINFPGDKVIDSASSCMLTQTKIKAQTLLKYGARPSDNICKIEFTHIPVGLKQGYVCSTEQECIDSYFNPDSQNTFEIDKGLVFTGKLLDPKDDKFSYKITRLNGFDIGQDSNGQRIIDITESDPLVYESSIAGVTAFNDGVIFEVSPAIVDGHNFAAVVPVGMTPGIQVVHDRAQAAGVVAQGKTPVLVEIGGYAEVIKSVNVDNFASYLFQLGAPKATGYQFSYKVTALDAAGVNLSTRSGVQVIKDAAPTLTPLTTTAAYIVGGPGTTPQAEFGLLGRDADTTDTVTLSVDTAPTNGTLDLSKPGKAIYTPKPGFFGGDKFIVRATDGFGAFTVSTQYVNVVNGGVIESSITAPVKVSGYTPFTAGLALKLTDPKNSSNIGSVQWQRQPAGGGDWAPAGTGVTLKATLAESGTFNYRAVVTNKWSQAQSTTNVVQLEAITAPLPNLKLVSRMSSVAAPSNVNLTLLPVGKDDAEIMGKGKLTYTWTYPDTVQGKFSGTMANMLIAQQGVYQFNVKVTDALGRSADYPSTIEILRVVPDQFTMELRKAQLYEREPMSYSIRAGLRLGAKGDTVSTYTLKIDDTVVGTPSNVMPRFIAGVPAGAHTISLSYESANGSRGSKSVQVNVAQNQPPVCTMTKTEYAKYMVTKVAATCKDNDGKLKGYQWIVDDVVQKSGASSIMVNMKDRTDSANVVFKALDDSGAIGGFETTVTKPVMP